MQYFGKSAADAGFLRSSAPLFAFFAIFIISANFAQAQESAQILQQSITTLQKYQTIECNLRMSVWVDKIEYASKGRYEEQAVLGKSPAEFLRSMYRLDINSISDVPLAPGMEPNRMTLVCHISADREKSQIWQYQSVENQKTLRFIRLVPLEIAVQKSKRKTEFSSIAAVENLGGLAATLHQILRIYEFGDVPVEETQESQTVWRLSGTLRKASFDALLKQFGGLGKKDSFPSDFPSDIEIHIGQDDIFPYKISFLNRPTENSPKRTPLSETAYFDVVVNGDAIPASNFAPFSENGERPEGLFDYRDDTNLVIRQLGL